MALHDLTFLEPGAEWPPPSERKRLKKYEDNRKLWNNKQDEVYGEWFRVLREASNTEHVIIFNFHKRLSTLWAQMIFGDPPSFTSGEPSGPPEDTQTTVVESPNPDEPTPGAPTGSTPEQDTLDRIVETTKFVTVGREAVLDVSRYGDALFKVRIKDNEAHIQAQSPAIWFPVTSRDDQREVLFHVLAWTFHEDDVDYLRCEIHSKAPLNAPPLEDGLEPEPLTQSGFIENRLYELKGDRIHARIPLVRFFPNREDVEETRSDKFLIVHVPGLRASDEFYGKDDYEEIDSTVLEYMARTSQLSRVQDKHSDPSMYGDEDLETIDPRTGQSVFQAGGRFFGVREGGVPPSYLIWDASQAQMFEFMRQLKEDLFLISETSSTAFGISETGVAESGTSLALRMQNTVNKARDIRNNFDPAVKATLILAAELEAAWGLGASPPETLNIQWKSGLPDDPKEKAEIEQIRLASGNRSRWASIKELDGGTDEEIQDEIDRIDEDRASAQPPSLNAPEIPSPLDPATGQPGDQVGDRASRILEGLRGGGGAETNRFVGQSGELRRVTGRER